MGGVGREGSRADIYVDPIIIYETDYLPGCAHYNIESTPFLE